MQISRIQRQRREEPRQLASVTLHVQPPLLRPCLRYQHLEEAEGKPSGSEPEQERHQQLAQGVARLRGELQQLDLQIETAQREVMADEVSLEVAQERIRDAQRRSLLLKAYAARLAKERQQLQGSIAQLWGRLEQLKDISRKAKVELTVGGKVPDFGFAGLEPEVLRDVRTACQLRFHFLKSLFEHSTSGARPSGTSEELLDASYQHWLSTVEDIVGSHPPNHVLAALEHLALENTLQMQELTSRIDIPRDVEALKFRYESSRLEDLAGPPAALPSVRGLIQEGWSRCEELWVQQLPLQAREQRGTAQLSSLVQEMHRLLADGSEHAILARAVLELELRAVRLAGLRDGLRRGCQELEQEASARHAELQALQSKRQRILDFRHLVREKQQHVRALIKGTSYIKSQLRKDQAEVQAFVQRKLLGPEQDVTLESQRLHGGVEREVRQLGAIALPCLLDRSLPGSTPLVYSALNLPRAPWGVILGERGQALSPLTPCVYLSLPQAPEHLLPHMAELKKELLALRAQLGYKSQVLASLQQRQGTDVQVLLQALRDHDREQAGALGPRIQLVTEQCERRIERWPEVQATIDAWWEQPGQFSLPAEHRQGLTLRQWLERWTLALKTLQQHSWA
ncbi:HAUS augmin-like complex subunit 5 [Natator depressus]|uniref:HAUS augmin-like complex subunit 5 n=1 Tax=Natator depressus TaxID=27790 RepID=UPI003EBC1B7E